MTLQGSNRLPSWLWPLAVLAVTALAFLPALENGWVEWDDGLAFLENPSFRGLSPDHLHWMWTTFDVAMYRPLTWMTYGADFLLWGMDPFGYHLTSLVIHLANALLFYFFAAFMLERAVPSGVVAEGRQFAAAVAALVFAVHPMRVEAVAWISARADLLATFFVLLSLLAYVRHYGRDTLSLRSRWIAASLIAYAASLLSKPLALTFPLVLLLLDVYPLKRFDGGWRSWLASPNRAVILEKVPFLLLALAISPVIYLAKAVSVPGVVGSRILLGAALLVHGIAFHLWKTLVPFDLAPHYEMPFRFVLASPRILASAVAVAAITVLLVKFRKQVPALLAAWIYYVLVFAPTSGFIPYGGQMGADRYTYLSGLGWALLAGGALLLLRRAAAGGWIDRRLLSLAAAGSIAFIAGLSLLTWRQAQVWRDTGALWSHAVRVQPRSSFSHGNLAVFLAARGEVAAAVPHFRRAAEIDPAEDNWEVNLIAALYATGNQGEAGARANRFLLVAENDALAYRQLAVALFSYGQLDRARPHFERAIELAPGDAESVNGLAVLLVREGRVGEAERFFRRALELRPRYPAAHYNLGNALVGESRFAEAAVQFAEAVRQDPGSVEARASLADALVATGRPDAAVEEYRKTIRVEPRHTRAMNNLGFVLMSLGRTEEAVRYLERAVQLDPTNPGARQNLEAARARLGRRGLEDRREP